MVLVQSETSQNYLIAFNIFVSYFCNKKFFASIFFKLLSVKSCKAKNREKCCSTTAWVGVELSTFAYSRS